MDGIHDLGGKHGFGLIDREQSEQAFPEHWQGAVFTMANALFFAGIARNADHFRHAIERIDPISYLTDGYYGRWLGGIETLLVEAGQLSQAELTVRASALGVYAEARVAARPSDTPDAFPPPPAVDEAAPTAQRPSAAPPAFQLGQKVLTAATPVPGHTRLPAYARGVSGRVVAHHGAWVFPDSNAHGRGEAPAHLYTVLFDGQTLWGDAADDDMEVCLDLFEPYLSPGGSA